MYSEEKQIKNKVSKPLLLIAMLSTTVFLLCLVGWHLYTQYFNDGKIHGNVYIGGVPVSLMTPRDAASFVEVSLREEYDNAAIPLKSSLGDSSIRLTDIDYTYNFEEAAAEAYSLGRTADVMDNIIFALMKEKEPVHIALKMQYDKDKLSDLVNTYVNETQVIVKQPAYGVTGNRLNVISGHPGEIISAEKALTLTTEAVEAGNFSEIEVPVVVFLPDVLDTEAIYNEIIVAPINAKFEVENNSVVTVPHQNGRDVDREILDNFLSEIQVQNDRMDSLALDEVIPEMHADNISSMLFRDTIGDFHTDFEIDTQNGKNRSVNIQLASQAINGLVLAPGEVFSYNDVVGPRTAAKGYKSAVVYSGGQILTGIGGGICQVSTTLYNAVLQAGLEVVERNPHNFTVGYADLGFDATVTFNVQDIKFRNSSGLPIKLEISFPQKTRVRVEIRGTNLDPSTAFEYKSVIINTKAFTVVYREDPKLKVGGSYIFQAGKTGYTVDAYKITKVNGIETDRVKLYRNVYNPYPQIVYRNTGSVPPAQPTDPVSPPATEPPDLEPPEPIEPSDPNEPPVG